MKAPAKQPAGGLLGRAHHARLALLVVAAALVAFALSFVLGRTIADARSAPDKREADGRTSFTRASDTQARSNRTAKITFPGLARVRPLPPLRAEPPQPPTFVQPVIVTPPSAPTPPTPTIQQPAVPPPPPSAAPPPAPPADPRPPAPPTPVLIIGEG